MTRSSSSSSPAPEVLRIRGDLAAQPLSRQVLRLAFWPFLELLLHATIGLVDTAIAGLIDARSLDAVGVAAYIGWMVSMLHSAVGVGTAALVARATGSGRRALANAALGQAMIVALVWGVMTAVGIAVFAHQLAWLFGMPEHTSAVVVGYLRVLALGVVFTAILQSANAALRASGDTRTPFLAMVATNLVNIVVAVLLALPGRQLVLGPGEWGFSFWLPGADMGVRGIAIGAICGWATGMAVVLGVLLRSRGRLRLRWRWLRPHARTMQRIIRVGVPSLVEGSGMWLGNAILGGIVGMLMVREGVDGLMGAHMIAIRVESLSYLPGMAIGIAAATLTGQYLGRGDPETAARAVRFCWGLAASLMGCMGVLFLLVPQLFTHALAPSAEVADVRDMAEPLLRIAGLIQVCFATYMVLSQALRGAGDTLGPMFITYGCTFLVRLPLAYVLAIPLGFGLQGLWVGLCAELVVRALLYTWRFRAGRWRRARV